jgi:hypothetical protein
MILKTTGLKRKWMRVLWLREEDMKTWPPEGPPLGTNFSPLRILLHSTANRLSFDAGERCCRQSMTEYQAWKKESVFGAVIS